MYYDEKMQMVAAGAYAALESTASEAKRRNWVKVEQFVPFLGCVTLLAN